MTQNFPDNTLYELDNLDVLRGMNSETVDLIATDPPFITKRNRSGTGGHYVDKWKWGDIGILPDQWKWNEVHPKWLEEIKDDNPALHQVIEAARVCHDEDIAAFLCFLSVRLLECHRILKPTGSIYLHCDHAANSYIRMAMDAIFGKNNFRNEIVWCYTGPSNTKRWFPRKHDTVFFYAKSKSTKLNRDAVRIPYNAETLARRGRVEGDQSYISSSVETTGRRDSEQVNALFGDGKVPEDWWSDIAVLTNQRERTGSPDQKPIALYERIIQASSNEGDLVLDPFCGCATTIIAAHNLNRRWVGIDRRTDARYHVVCRMAGISPEEREKLEKRPDLADWLHRQMDKYESYYRTEPPKRTDTGDTAAPTLKPVYPTNEEYRLTHKEMRDILIERFGLHCWGCDFEAPDERYLDLDHIDRKSNGGSNHLDNRALLCGPCNRKKANRITLVQLRKENQKDGHITNKEHPIPIIETREWARQYMIRRIQETPHQLNLSGR